MAESWLWRHETLSILKPWRFFVEKRIHFGNDGRRVCGLGEYCRTQRHEFGARQGHLQRRFHIRPAHDDAGDLDHRGPPFAERQILRMRFGLDIAIELAEEDIVGPQLANLQSAVPFGSTAAADDQLRNEFLHGISKLREIASDMQPVGLRPPSHAAVTGDKRCSTGRLNDRHQLFRMLLKRAVIQPILGNDHRGDIAAPQRIGNGLRLFLDIGDIGDDENEAATIFGHGHASFHGFGFHRQRRLTGSIVVSKSVSPL
ncbi:hypothetical protein RHSP_26500 [Rhizobium freirei PRF 81]|uniref:Uncharacterized protein n=1 Tax=Rhizobium freirei PRF 81 TaxID=363754 RepID=N6UAX6_9HYPH|nr:hypothetical protein RHSP_26500 [Rhizobium freirei PRF 81]